MAQDDEPKTTRRELLGAVVVVATGVGLGCDAPLVGEDTGVARDAPGTDGAGTDGGAHDVGAGTDAASVDASSAPDAATPPEPPPESVAEASLATFPLGVACGDAVDDTAVFWTRYAGTRELELVVWEMAGEVYARTVVAMVVVASEGGFVHADVMGLAPGARHRYVFFEREAGVRSRRSPIGRMRAPLAADALEPLVLAACSCTSNSRAADTLARAGQRDDLDVFLYLGDTAYNDGAESLGEYRESWQESLSREGYRAIRAASSALATWDDHEFDNDWNPETFDPDQRAAAIQTFFEHQPVRRDPAAPERVWKSVRWGRTAEIFVLDCRAERRPSTRSTASAEYVSRAQMDWLKDALSASDAVFKIIMNSVPIADFPGAFDFAQNDRWEGYAAQRTEILRHIDDGAITGVLWVAGDFHLASAQRVSTSGPGATQVEILAGPGAQSANLLARFLGGDQFDFATGDNNYTLIELDPATGVARIWWIDGDGSTLETLEYALA